MSIPADSTCPHCGKGQDAASYPDGPTADPRPGDWSLCFYCGVLCVFTETLYLPEGRSG